MRTIKPDFWSSPGVGRCSLRARLLYIAMWNWADDYGIGTANPRELVSFAFPNDDDVSASDFPTLRKEVADNFDVVFYTVRERPYYSIPSWDEHQRTERKAKRYHPGPDESDCAPDQARWVSSGTSDATQGTSDATQGSSALGSRKLEVGNTSSVAATTDRDRQLRERRDRFDEFWSVKPSRGPKQANPKAEAKKVWDGLVRTVNPDRIIASARLWAKTRQGEEPQFTPQAVTWLRQKRWDDDVAEDPEPQQSGGSYTAPPPPEEMPQNLFVRWNTAHFEAWKAGRPGPTDWHEIEAAS
jgi:hypothetical protein